MNNSFVGHADLFPTAVAKYRRADHEHLKEIILKILENYPQNEIYTEGENLVHYFNDGNFDPRQYAGLENFMDWILDCVKNYADSFLGIRDKNFIDCNVWINSNKGGAQKPHQHFNSFISATYYIQLDKEHSGLNFYNPKNSGNLLRSAIDIPYDVQTIYTTPYQPLMVEQGDLLIWPSELIHGYDQDNVQMPRISMSMNFMPEILTSKLYGFKVSKL